MASVGKVILPTYAQCVTSYSVKATFHTIRVSTQLQLICDLRGLENFQIIIIHLPFPTSSLITWWGGVYVKIKDQNRWNG